MSTNRRSDESHYRNEETEVLCNINYWLAAYFYSRKSDMASHQNKKAIDQGNLEAYTLVGVVPE